MDIIPETLQQTPRKIPLYKKPNWDAIELNIKKLHSRIKEMAILKADINMLWQTFTHKLKENTDKFIPRKKYKRAEVALFC